MKSLFTQRSFWVALFGLIVIVLAAALPGFNVDVEHIAGLAAIVASYIIAFALNPAGDALAGMLTSRKFWAAIFGFVVVILDAFHVFPNPLDVVSLAGLIALIFAYMLALAVDPGKGWRGLLVSRKFWATVVGVVVIFMNAFNLSLPAGLSPEQIVGVVVLVGSYVAGVGLEGPPAPLPEPGIDEME